VSDQMLWRWILDKISACIIAWNEEELLPYALKFLDSQEQITEVCIVVDEESTDRTLEICEDFPFRSDVKKYVRMRYFDNFADQKNAALEMAHGDWILLMDADETYTDNIRELFSQLHRMKWIHAVRIPTMLMYSRNKMCRKTEPDPHIRLWKKGFARYEGTVHETLVDIFGRDLHSCYDSDMLNTLNHVLFNDVWMKHYQFLKSDKSLLEKGQRWKKFFADSASKGAVLDEMFWVRVKGHEPESWGIQDLPEVYWDVTTNMK